MCFFVQEWFVDEAGCYTEDAGPALHGLSVIKGSEAVMALMSENILPSEHLVHSYPYDWRTRQPVILRASCQWFIDISSIKEKAIVSYPASEIFIHFRLILRNVTTGTSWSLLRSAFVNRMVSNEHESGSNIGFFL
jgi:isoleucyl-tRNA synthetase